MRTFLDRHRPALAVAATVVSLAVAVTYLFVVPVQAATASGWVRLLLRYGHSACWVLLAAASLCWLFGAPRPGRVLAWAALACYGAFLAAVLLS